MPGPPLYDPAATALWARLATLAGALRSLRCWRRCELVSRHRDTHLHEIPTLVVGLAGTSRVLGPDGACDLAPGDALLIAPCVRHQHAPLRRDAAYLHLGFVPRWSDVAIRAGRHWHWGRVPMQPYRAALERVLAVAEHPPALAELRALIARLAGERIEHLAIANPAVERMTSLLWWRFEERLTAADLVRASGLGRSQAHRLFRAFHGQTPKQALLDRRLALARQLIAGGHAVTAVAAACGFASRAGLTRAFRQRFGRPPRAWRGA